MAKAHLIEPAKILFLEGYTQKEIAKKLLTTEVTVSRWAKIGNWDNLKKNLVVSKTERIGELYAELTEFQAAIKGRPAGQRFATSKEADVRRKLIRDISDLERKYNIGQTTVIARDFVIFSRDIDFEFSQKANDYFDLFINNQIDKQKWQKD